MMGNITQSAPVPGYYIGVWQRDLLETSTCKDDRSQMFWMQTPLYHIDLRIPASRINLSQVQSLQNYTYDELLQLATQQGFAGVTQVTPSTAESSEVCQWLREMDFQPNLNVK